MTQYLIAKRKNQKTLKGGVTTSKVIGLLGREQEVNIIDEKFIYKLVFRRSLALGGRGHVGNPCVCFVGRDSVFAWTIPLLFIGGIDPMCAT